MAQHCSGNEGTGVAPASSRSAAFESAAFGVVLAVARGGCTGEGGAEEDEAVPDEAGEWADDEGIRDVARGSS